MPVGLVSSYLPVNALLRLGFSKLANPVWFNPFLALAGGAALLDIARRTFGRQDRACWVVLLVYVLSAQMLVNAMTPFSVTGHMAVNLIWLAAFLRGGKLGHSAAIVTGFVAVGLHQLVFHPVFVAPFLLVAPARGAVADRYPLRRRICRDHLVVGLFSDARGRANGVGARLLGSR